MKRYQICVFGRVQGVFFRANTKKKAAELNVVGFVMNKPDKSVYIEAEGDEENLGELLKWCQIGSAQANVTKVVENEVNVQGVESEFKIQH